MGNYLVSNDGVTDVIWVEMVVAYSWYCHRNDLESWGKLRVRVIVLARANSKLTQV